MFGTKRKKRWFTVDDFHFDEKTKKLVCPAGQELYKSGTNFKTTKGYISSKYKAKITACRNCSLRKKCLRNETSPQRQVQIFHNHVSVSILDNMKQKIDTTALKDMGNERQKTIALNLQKLITQSSTTPWRTSTLAWPLLTQISSQCLLLKRWQTASMSTTTTQLRGVLSNTSNNLLQLMFPFLRGEDSRNSTIESFKRKMSPKKW